MPKSLANAAKKRVPLSTKHRLRYQALQQLKKIDWDFVNERVGSHLQESLEKKTDLVLAGYSALADEPNIEPFLDFWRQRGGVCCLPVILEPKKPLVFRLYQGQSCLIPGPYQILTPHPQQPLLTPQIVLVPLLGFDKKRNRLGRGGGYYDRTIQKLRQQNPSCHIIGIAAQQQCFPLIPMQKHDQPLDCIMTEQGVF